MSREAFGIVFIIAIVALDSYVFQSIRALVENYPPFSRKLIYVIYWILAAITIGCIIGLNFVGEEYTSRDTRNLLLVWIFMYLLSKLLAVLFVLSDDIIRLFKWTFSRAKDNSLPGKPIPRSEFLAKSSLVAGALPFVTMGVGILSGAHNYKIRRNTIVLPNLPHAFDGVRIAQISDLHTGSFYNKAAVDKGVDMLLGQKPDMIFFTGDMVNYETAEIKPYFDIYRKIQAPLGVYSVLGNHDYGDYKSWPSAEAKRKNLEDLKAAERSLGWNLLLNENRRITVDGESIGILGVENWGKGRFHKYGDLEKANKGMEEMPVKLLLSHDPSHWDAIVRPDFKDIDITFSGHTHGFQFGIEIGNFQWSPVQYVYKQWAGLYQEAQQYLYVNRGFGFLVYPGRIGIWPEITIIELKRA